MGVSKHKEFFALKKLEFRQRFMSRKTKPITSQLHFCKLLVAYVAGYTSKRGIVLVECGCWSTGTSDFRTVEEKMSSH